MKGKNWSRFIALLRCTTLSCCIMAFAQFACAQAASSLPESSQTQDSEGQIGVIKGRTMGTTYLIKLRSTDSAGKRIDLEQLKIEVEERLVEINASMSTYDPNSEISRLNQRQSTDPFSVSTDFSIVLSKAMEVFAVTDGRFDVTVGPLVRLWGFGGGKQPKSIPDATQIESVLSSIGTKNLSLESGQVVKKIPGLEVDFSAIAKGYAVDELAKIVGQRSEDLLVEVGGEVFAKGRNPDSGNAWAIGVEVPATSPLDMNRPRAARIELSSKALATSGDYRNLVVIDGKKFQHTIDPRTGFPVDNGIHSVSVIADDCMTADALATGFMVCPLDKIQELATTLKVGVFVIYDNGEGELNHWKSEQFGGDILINSSLSDQAAEQTVGQKSADVPAVQGDKANPIYMVIGTIIVFGLAICGMAIGVIMSNRQLKGSCGGLSAMAGNEEVGTSPCSLCTKPASECSKRSNADLPEESAAE